jgi:hypothetical protein
MLLDLKQIVILVHRDRTIFKKVVVAHKPPTASQGARFVFVLTRLGGSVRALYDCIQQNKVCQEKSVNNNVNISFFSGYRVDE